MNYQKVEPLDLDHMPAEVATEMLVAPKAKLTNRMRKQCFAARQKVFFTGLPLRRVPEGPVTAHSTRDAFKQLKSWPLQMDHDWATEMPLPEDIAAKKLRAIPIDRLDRSVRRIEKRVRSTQLAIGKFEEKLVTFPEDSRAAKQAKKLLASLRAVEFDLSLQRGFAITELRRRMFASDKAFQSVQCQ